MDKKKLMCIAYELSASKIRWLHDIPVTIVTTDSSFKSAWIWGEAVKAILFETMMIFGVIVVSMAEITVGKTLVWKCTPRLIHFRVENMFLDRSLQSQILVENIYGAKNIDRKIAVFSSKIGRMPFLINPGDIATVVGDQSFDIDASIN
uniref:Uncharacterized protein n=1 Tax=Romanomermis culicivorax TaxID=13658 RepID=A0A915JG75_ROMCU